MVEAYSISDDLPDLTGTYVDGDRLYLESILGEGGFGKVYLARDYYQPQEHGGAAEYCAVKCLVNPIDPKDAYAKVVRRELAIHSLVSNHPNIITSRRTFLDASKKHRFVVLDLAAFDLFEAIVVKGVFRKDDEKTRKAFLQILDAVEYCHDAGIAHGDIKPENVLCNTTCDRMWLTDFGLATFSRLESSGQGSSFYMSPELVSRKYRDELHSTNHCDIWALGVLLVNFVTQRNPWTTAKSGDKCFDAYLNDRDWLGKILPISSGLNEILKRALHLNPLCRLPLSSFRKAVLELDTFFKDTEQQFIMYRMQEQIKEMAAADEGSLPEKEAQVTEQTQVLMPEVPATPVLDSPIPGTPKKKAMELRESTKAKKSPIQKFISKFVALGSPGSKNTAKVGSISSPKAPAVPAKENLPVSEPALPSSSIAIPAPVPISVSAPTPAIDSESREQADVDATPSICRDQSTESLLRVAPPFGGYSSSSSASSGSTAPSSIMAITPPNASIVLPGAAEDAFTLASLDPAKNNHEDPFASDEDRTGLGLTFGLGLAVQTLEPLELLEVSKDHEVAVAVGEVDNGMPEQKYGLDALL